MADNNDEKKCPLCGKHTKENEDFCENCREIANTAYPEELLTKLEEDGIKINIKTENKTEEIKTEDTSIPKEVIKKENKEEEQESQIDSTPVQQPLKRKNIKKTLIFFFLGLFILIGVGGIGSYFFVEIKNAEETEIGYWEKCLAENTPLAFSKYLVQYPEGKYSEQAYSNIIMLKEKERKEWEDLRKSKNVEALILFLKNNPNTPYDREIRHSIDSLTWETAIEKNTKEAYLAYIENAQLGHYLGEFINQAQQKFNYLDQLKTVEGEELKEIQKVYSNFFKALSSVNSKGIQNSTDTVLTKFYESSNQKNNTIADSIKASLKKNKIKSVTYTPITDSLVVTKDNQNIYYMSIPIQTTTIYSDRKKQKKNEKHSLNIQLNKEKQIQLVEKE